MTVATSDSPTAQTHTGPVVHLVRTGPRRLRLDLISASALVVAVGGLGASIIVLRSLQDARPVEPNLSTAAVPIRDQWYLEAPTAEVGVPSAMNYGGHEDPAGTTAQLMSPSAAAYDQAVAGSTGPLAAAQTRSILGSSATSVSAARDRWYEDLPSTTRVATPKGDRWYLEQQAVQTASSPASTTSMAKDRWYLDAARPSIASTSNVPPLRDQWYLDQGGVTSRDH